MIKESPLHFNGTWRSYQERILDNLKFHLRDKKLHVVAALGAGKTTLGIEVIARLNRPTLILCPTNTIKMQWRERICSSFLREEDHGMVSTLVRQPKYITIITYQALLAAFCGRAEEEEQDDDVVEEETVERDTITASARFKLDKANEIIATLREAGITLLCFDEAHHLRKEWWKALTYLNEQLKPEQTLALTATPPYDADLGEWKRYQELCGEIDEVISIPELVKNGDLCPHQDFIYISPLQQAEREMIEQHQQRVRTMIKKLLADKELHDILAGLPFFKVTDGDIELIFDNTQFYVSIASLLDASGYKGLEPFLELFDATALDLPRFDEKMATAFLDGLCTIKEECLAPLDAKREEYYNAAKKLGLVANKKIVLDESNKIRKLIAGSLGKLESIVKIVELENGQLGDKLRMVVLTDYIRMDDLECASIGVVPIWKTLTEHFGQQIPIGILCGSLVLLPESARDRLMQRLAESNIDSEAVKVTGFKDIAGYVRILPKEAVRNRIVSLVTEMFNAGDVTVLIGTQALLGEGWDAPSINSLILSSTVSSYMLSNQMRGRAIRIDRNNPNKVSNIWHLATFEWPKREELTSTSDEALENIRLYVHDMNQLAVRFDGYEAPAYEGNHEIRSGIERIIDLSPSTFMPQSEVEKRQMILRHQETTQALACSRAQTRQWWHDALHLGYSNISQIGLKTGVEARAVKMQPLLYKSSLWKIYSYIAALVAVLLSLMRYSHWFASLRSLRDPFWAFMSFLPFILIIGYLVVRLIVEVVRYIRTGNVAEVMRQVGIVMLETLSHLGAIKTSLKMVGIKVKGNQGMCFLSCTNLPAEENNLFLRSMQEFLDPIDNPRYVLVKHDRFRGLVNQKDYFAIPAVIAQGKEGVWMFEQLWQKYIGKCETVYTRNIEGRKLLLRARRDASSAANRERSKRLSKWQ